tara:strand:+ start:613 stop:1455 length:843 start_codon:yes stop_codon:yes gene_type:complete
LTVQYITGNAYKVIAVGNDPKTRKGEKQGYLTGILYMAPERKISRLITGWLANAETAPAWLDEYLDGVKARVWQKANLCPQASKGCAAACLDTAGHGGFSPSVPIGRARKTLLWLAHRAQFAELLRADIAKLQRAAVRRGLKAQVRLNGTTDIRWERYPAIRKIMTDFPQVDFYDYTKFSLAARRNLPANYKLTYSLSEKTNSWTQAERYLAAGRPVAVVFKSAADAKTVISQGSWRGYGAVDGDEHDARFYDGGVITALKPKGKARSGAGGSFLQAAAA